MAVLFTHQFDNLIPSVALRLRQNVPWLLRGTSLCVENLLLSCKGIVLKVLINLVDLSYQFLVQRLFVRRPVLFRVIAQFFIQRGVRYTTISWDIINLATILAHLSKLFLHLGDFGRGTLMASQDYSFVTSYKLPYRFAKKSKRLNFIKPRFEQLIELVCLFLVLLDRIS